MMPKERGTDRTQGFGLPHFDELRLLAKLKGAGGPDWRVFMQLASHANREFGDIAWPASSTLARELGMDESNVRKALRRLAAAGAIVAKNAATARRPATWSFAHLRKEKRPPIAPPGQGPRHPEVSSSPRGGPARVSDGRPKCGVCRGTGKTPIGVEQGRVVLGPCGCTKRGAR